MSHKNPRVSVVIPVIQRGRYFAGLFRGVIGQTAPPFEVLVVDNNSTDDSVLVAARYPFVTVLHEKRQGAACAQSGFTAARGDYWWIDADTEVAPDWIKQLQQVFTEDSELLAVVGQMQVWLRQDRGARKLV